MVVDNSQSFAAQPRTVAGAKYRPEDEDTPYYANIHHDKRVHRGSNYQRSEQNSNSTAGKNNTRILRRKKAEKVVDPFAIEVPKPERLPVDLLSHLVERPNLITQNSCGNQTAEFLPRPASPPFIEKRTGVDAATHIEEGDLFNFDQEVAPLLSVLVSKTIEQANLEIEESIELDAFAEYKKRWREERKKAKEEEDAIVAAEEERFCRKEKCKSDARDLKHDVAREKLLCVQFSKRFLSGLFPKALASLQDDHGLLCNRELKTVCTQFLPTLYTGIMEKLTEKQQKSDALNDFFLQNIAEEKIKSRHKAKQAHIEKVLAEKKRREEEEAARLAAQKAEEERLRLEEEEAARLEAEGTGEDGEGGE